jgi:hypothetical protein
MSTIRQTVGDSGSGGQNVRDSAGHLGPTPNCVPRVKLPERISRLPHRNIENNSKTAKTVMKFKQILELLGNSPKKCLKASFRKGSKDFCQKMLKP